HNMDMDTGEQVYLGTWTNWSRGSAVMGATLTMTQEHGNLLIAFTALFVPFAASRFWRIFAFVFHQCYSTSGPRDAIHHQRQVLLRNSNSPESGLLSFVRMLWAWRSSEHRPWARILPVAFFLFFSIGTFTVAGGFSSQLSTAGEVLLKGDDCEAATSIYTGNMTTVKRVIPYWSTFNNNIANYAQQCYAGQGTGLLQCAKFVTGAIQTPTMNYDAPCPFKSGICRQNSTNLRLDTGHMNSNTVFGQNAPKNETFTMRYVLQCAPLATEGRSRHIKVYNRTYVAYNYGPMIAGQNEIVNYTYLVPAIDSQYPKRRLGYGNGYTFLITPRQYYTYQGALDPDSSAFSPDPDVFVHDGDATIFFLSGNGVGFLSPAEDEWYRAAAIDTTYDVLGTEGNQTNYRPLEAASPLGCVERFQWCRDPDLGQCGDLDSALTSLESAARWFNLPDDVIGSIASIEHDRPIPQTKLGAILTWAALTHYPTGSTLQQIIETLGAPSLASQIYVRQNTVWSIKKNQWQLDVTRWWYIMLAGFQAKFVNTAQGSKNSPFPPTTFSPTNDYERDLCHNQVSRLKGFRSPLRETDEPGQKIRSSNYANFNIFGLALMYSVGMLIILISFAVEPLLGWLQKRGRYNQYAYLEWEGGTAIQLHRMANDQLGHGHWMKCDERIPITQPGDILASLDTSDPKHPMLAMDSGNTVPEEIKTENIGQKWSGKQTIHNTSAEHSDEGNVGDESAEERRESSDVSTNVPRGNRGFGIDDDIDIYPNRSGLRL
ncbi:hypothetical protein PG996_006137, partial [Apiospora saccharicola]